MKKFIEEKKKVIIIAVISLALLTGLAVKSLNKSDDTEVKKEDKIVLRKDIKIPLSEKGKELDNDELSKFILKELEGYTVKDIDVDLTKEAKDKKGTIILINKETKEVSKQQFTYDVVSKTEAKKVIEKIEKESESDRKTREDNLSNERADENKDENNVGVKDKVNKKAENDKNVVKDADSNKGNDKTPSTSNNTPTNKTETKPSVSKPAPQEKEEVSYTWKDEKYGEITTERKADPNRYEGSGDQVIQEGSQGVRSVQYKVVKKGGKVVSETKTGETKIKSNPSPKIVSYGTKKKEGYNDSNQAQAVFNAVNNLRSSKGLAKLQWSNSIGNYASTRAKEISTDYSHWRPNGQYFNEGLLGVAAEVIAGEGFYSPQDALEGWIASPSHYSEIIANDVSYAGAGVYVDPNGNMYWVLITSATQL